MCDLLSIARQAGADVYTLADHGDTIEFHPATLATFAARILEEAAKVCDAQGDEWDSDAVITEKNYAHACAAAIRNLSSAGSTPSGVGVKEP